MRFRTIFCSLNDRAWLRNDAPINLSGSRFESLNSNSNRESSKGGSGTRGRGWGMDETGWPSESSGTSGCWQSKSCVGIGHGLSGRVCSPSCKWRRKWTTSCNAQIRKLHLSDLPLKSKKDFQKLRWTSKPADSKCCLQFRKDAHHGATEISIEFTIVGGVLA